MRSFFSSKSEILKLRDYLSSMQWLSNLYREFIYGMNIYQSSYSINLTHLKGIPTGPEEALEYAENGDQTGLQGVVHWFGKKIWEVKGITGTNFPYLPCR